MRSTRSPSVEKSNRTRPLTKTISMRRASVASSRTPTMPPSLVRRSGSRRHARLITGIDHVGRAGHAREPVDGVEDPRVRCRRVEGPDEAVLEAVRHQGRAGLRDRARGEARDAAGRSAQVLVAPTGSGRVRGGRARRDRRCPAASPARAISIRRARVAASRVGASAQADTVTAPAAGAADAARARRRGTRRSKPRARLRARSDAGGLPWVERTARGMGPTAQPGRGGAVRSRPAQRPTGPPARATTTPTAAAARRVGTTDRRRTSSRTAAPRAPRTATTRAARARAGSPSRGSRRSPPAPRRRGTRGARVRPEPVEVARPDEHEQERRREGDRRREEAATDPAAAYPDDRDGLHDGPGCDLTERDRVQELPVRHPVVAVDGVGLHQRDDHEAAAVRQRADLDGGPDERQRHHPILRRRRGGASGARPRVPELRPAVRTNSSIAPHPSSTTTRSGPRVAADSPPATT